MPVAYDFRVIAACGYAGRLSALIDDRHRLINQAAGMVPKYTVQLPYGAGQVAGPLNKAVHIRVLDHFFQILYCCLCLNLYTPDQLLPG